MRSIFQYITEEVHNQKVFSKIRSQVIAGLVAVPENTPVSLKKLQLNVNQQALLRYCQSKSSGHSSDIFKGAYGENDEDARETLEKILNLGLKTEGRYRVYSGYRIGDYKVWGRNNGSSSLYKGWEVTFDLDDSVSGGTATGYIVNTMAPERRSRTQSKLFTPNKLLDLSEGKTYKNVDDIITELLAKFRAMTEIDEGAADTMKKLVDVFSKELVVTDRTDAFASKDFDSYLAAPTGTITIKIPADTFLMVNDEMKNIIANDFGEILDGLLFLKLYEGQEVSFPESATEQAIDLNVITPGSEPITTGISAKANGGAAASGSQLLAFYNKLKSSETTDDVADAVEEYPDALTNEQKEFIGSICNNVWNKTMAYGQCWIVDKYFPKFPADVMKDIFGREYLCCADDKAQKKDIIDSLVSAIKDPNKRDNLLKLYTHSWETSKYRATDQNKLDLKDKDKFIEKLQSLVSSNSEGIYGLLVYPAYAYSVNKSLNSDTNKEILTGVCNKFLSYRQVYLKFGKDTITWTSKQASTASWKFECGNATTKPFVKKLSIRMVK